MIDLFSLLLSHGLILFACWRLLSRDDLDREPAAGSGVSNAPPVEPESGDARWS